MSEILRQFIKGGILASPWQIMDFGQSLARLSQDQTARARIGLIKRAVDIGVSSLLLALLAPLFCVLALVIKIDIITGN